jgi:DNA-binding transcriptional LysR family regulator
VLEGFGPPAAPIHVVYPSRRLGSANIAAFVAAARAHFRAGPAGPGGG